MSINEKSGRCSLRLLSDLLHLHRKVACVSDVRELLHLHSQQPFTRSDTIEIPADVTCVVVRGHDQTHGYGGLAMLADLDTGATRTIDQGSDRRTFETSDCP